MNIAIENLTVIEEEYLKDFVFKKELSEIELYGLEWILGKLLFEYFDELGIEAEKEPVEIVNDYTIHKKDRLSVLDGVTDIMTIGISGVSEVFLTENNIVVLKCVEVDDEFNPIEDTEHYVSIG